MVKNRSRFLVPFAIVLIIVGALIDIFTAQDIAGTALIALGVVIIAIYAGRGRPRGGRQDRK